MKSLSRILGLSALGTAFFAPLPAQEQSAPMPTPQFKGLNESAPRTVPPPHVVEALTQSEELIGPINMPGDSVDSTLALMERWTGKAILRPQNLPEASITLVLREKVTKREAVQAIETLLNMNGIALTPLGTRFLKATPLNLAKSEAPEFIDGSTLELTPSGRTVQKLFQLTFLRIGEFMPQIAGLLNPATGSPPIIFEKTNSALVTDSVSNLQRIETLVAQLDQPMLAGLQPKFYPLSNVKASDLVNKLRALFTGPLQNQLGTATTYNADDRTNQIILMSDPRQHAFFDDLITKLDVKSETNNRNEVIYLKHAAAKDVASVLSQLVSGQTTAAKANGQESINRPGQPAAPLAPGAPAPQQSISAASLGLPTDGSNQFSGAITILPEERTNAIVVSGNLDDIRLIQKLVDQLDIILAQVRIEIVIAEVTLSDDSTSGIESLGLNVVNGRLAGFRGSVAGGSIGGANVEATKDTPASANGLATFRAGTNDLIGFINLSSTPRKGNTTILSVPTITTTHNKEAKIFVGETRPIISGSTTSPGASTGTNLGYNSSSITQQEIGITITVKPLIGTDGSVQLDLKQEISDVGDTVKVDANTQYVILKRTTSSFITAKSGEILVLGGLQKKAEGKSTSRFGPIPFIGDLFGARTRTNHRTELVFFLRPTVLTNTSMDNAPALEEVEHFPAKQRDAVKQVLGVQPKK